MGKMNGDKILGWKLSALQISDLLKVLKFSQINFSFTQYQIISKCSACLKATMDHKCAYAKQGEMISKRHCFGLL